MAFPGAPVGPYLVPMMPGTLVADHISHLEACIQPYRQDRHSLFSQPIS